MEIHLTQSDLVTIINPHISHSDSGLKLNIMNGHAIKVFYPDEISDISIVDKQLYVVAKVSNDDASFYDDSKKLTAAVVGVMSDALNAEENSFKISDKDIIGKASTSKSTYYFIKLDKLEAW